jgi:tyrosyl-tRNA synthetase
MKMKEKKIYDVLKDSNLIENRKEFKELFWNKMIKVNDKVLDNMNMNASEIYKVQVGLKEILI